jgi:hypothetical protein
VCAQRGKQGNEQYAQLTVYIRREQKKHLQSDIVWLELDLSEAVEQLVDAYLDGRVDLIGKAEAKPPQPTRPRKTPVVERVDTGEGSELSVLREQLNLSQQQLSDKLAEQGIKVSKTALGRYERGQRAAPVEVVEAVRKLAEGSEV